MKPKAQLIGGSAIALFLAGAALAWISTGRQQAAVAAHLPPPPALDSLPPALRDRLTEAETAARQRLGAIAALGKLARLYHANGFLQEAASCYAGLEILQPNEPQWWHLHATILAGYGELDAALACWQRVRQLAPAYLPALLRSGDGLLKVNRAPEAAAAYEAALIIEPANPYALLGLARLDFEAGRWTQARPRLEQVVAETHYALGYDLIVALYERLGLSERATQIRAMTKASGAYRDAPDPWVDSLMEDCLEPYRLSLAAGTLARSGDPGGAQRLLERALLVAPDDVSANFQLGTLLVTLGNRAAAERHLRRCTELSPDFADGWAHLSALLASAGDKAGAERTLAEGLRHCPQSPGLHLQNAHALRRAGRLPEAIAEFQVAQRLRPNEAEAFLALGSLYLSQGRHAESVVEMERALAAEPGHEAALGFLALHAIMFGDETVARARLAAVRAQPRISGEQWLQLVNAYQKRFGHAP